MRGRGRRPEPANQGGDCQLLGWDWDAGGAQERAAQRRRRAGCRLWGGGCQAAATVSYLPPVARLHPAASTQQARAQHENEKRRNVLIAAAISGESTFNNTRRHSDNPADCWNQQQTRAGSWSAWVGSARRAQGEWEREKESSRTRHCRSAAVQARGRRPPPAHFEPRLMAFRTRHSSSTRVPLARRVAKGCQRQTPAKRCNRCKRLAQIARLGSEIQIHANFGPGQKRAPALHAPRPLQASSSAYSAAACGSQDRRSQASRPGSECQMQSGGAAPLRLVHQNSNFEWRPLTPLARALARLPSSLASVHGGLPPPHSTTPPPPARVRKSTPPPAPTHLGHPGHPGRT